MATIKELTFESGSLTGADAFSSVYQLAPATMTIENSDPLIDTNYVKFFNEAGATSAQVQGYIDLSPYVDEVYVAFYIRMHVHPTANMNIFQVFDGSLNLTSSIRVNSSGQLILLENATTIIGSASTPLTVGETYRVEYRRRKSVSSDGILELWLAEGNAPATLVASKTTNTNTAQIRRVQLNSWTSMDINFDLDQITLDDTSMPVLEALPATAGEEVDVEFEMGLETDLEFPPPAFADAEFDIVYDVEFDSVPHGIVNVEFEIVLGAESFDATETVTPEVEFSFGVGLAGTESAANHVVDIEFGLQLTVYEEYIGPGSGFVVGGTVPVSFHDRLREGDRFPTLWAWAGVEGITGVSHVLSRIVRSELSQQEVVVHPEITDDPKTVPQIQRSEPPAPNPPKRGSLTRAVQRQGQELRRIKRRT